MHKNQTVNYLSVEHVAKSYGERILFEDISFGINQGQKIGFVAKNGTGKTTLMETLMGMQTPDDGKISIRKGIRVGYLPQNPIFSSVKF